MSKILASLIGTVVTVSLAGVATYITKNLGFWRYPIHTTLGIPYIMFCLYLYKPDFPNRFYHFIWRRKRA